MRAIWAKKIQQGLLLLGLVGAGVSLGGCADEYASYPGYHGGYYASYSSRPYYPYYGAYGYPYRPYGPYYGAPYYGYGSPYYGGASFAVSSSSRSYVYRDQYGRLHRRRHEGRVRNTTRRTQTGSPRTEQQRYQSDDERKYYSPR